MAYPYDLMNEELLKPNDGEQNGLGYIDPSHNDLPQGLAVRARAKKREEEQRRHRLGLPHFDEDEYREHMLFWSSAGLVMSSHSEKGLVLETMAGDTIHIQKDRITINSGATDATLRALVIHAKKNWNNSLVPSYKGREEEKARVWAHCQVHGVKFDWQPSSEMAANMKPFITRLSAQENNTFTPTLFELKRLERDLQRALSSGNTEAVKSALDSFTVVLNDRDVCQQNRGMEGLARIILQTSIEHGHPQAFDAVLNYGVYAEANNHLAMRTAQAVGTPHMVQTLLMRAAKSGAVMDKGVSSSEGAVATPPRAGPLTPAP